MDYTGKNILITQSALRNLSGSEIVTLELASFFKESGANVIVFTWYYDEPMRQEFKKRNINVTTDENDKNFDNVDLVWVHHQVLPISIIKKLKNDSKTRFFFYHMSYMKELFLEQPYVLNLEKNLADKSIFVSEEALDMNMEKFGSIFRKPSVFRNASPKEFIVHFKTNDAPKKVGIVSNHPPKEILETIDLVKKSGIDAELIGNNSSIYRLVTPEILKQYDCIITIGKTVQYCLTSNIPVYLYDHFGGCGYLNKDNFEAAKKTNFSGRGFNKKTSSQISAEIINGYSEAKTFQEENLELFQQQFSLEKNMAKLFKETSPRQKTPFTTEYINYVKAAEGLVKDKVVAENNLCILAPEAKETIAKLENTINSLNSTIATMNNSRIIRLDKKIRRIISSPNRIQKIIPKKKQLVAEINKKDYETVINKKGSAPIVGLVLERNESLILKDTLDELCKIVDGFILLDDCSNDNSLVIAKSHPKCLATIKHKVLKSGDRSAEESIHRELLLRCAQKFNPTWLVYQDADERIEDGSRIRKFLLEHTEDKTLTGIKISLFDAYMTKGDKSPYVKGQLLNFRKYFGQERRDILMIWRNAKQVSFGNKFVAREPDGVDEKGVITKFYVQHYGKSLSVEQWEETCDYYVNHFPQYAEKWAGRKGKAIHDKKSDFGTQLLTWEEVKKKGGIKID